MSSNFSTSSVNENDNKVKTEIDNKVKTGTDLNEVHQEIHQEISQELHQELHQEVPQEILDQVEKLDVEEDFEINDIIDPDNIEKLIKEKLKLNNKEIKKEAKKKAGKRVAEKKQKKEKLSDCMENVSTKDMPKVIEKAKETVKSIEEKAKMIEEGTNMIFDEDEYETNKELYKEFLFNDSLHSITNNGIDTNLYINHYNLIKYVWSNGPNSALITDIPHQLVYVHKLNKLFDFQFIQQSDVSIKFNDLDRMICAFIKQNPTDTYKLSYDILKGLLKKILVASLTNVEFAFRSDKIWISPSFKKFALSDVIMMQALSGKLKNSYKIFVDELFKTKNSRIFNNTKILDKLVHTIGDFELEEVLANSIKCMTPCFILDYFNAIKSAYLFVGLLNIYMNRLGKRMNLLNKEDIELIARICVIVYQNTRLNQNITGRQLPLYEKHISEETQMYYLNHTIVGPQFLLLKMLEKSSPYLYEIMSEITKLNKNNNNN